MQNEELIEKIPILNKTFTPSAPISRRELFLGRSDQIMRVLDAATRPGQHVIMYGERGVGKTSLANVIRDFFPEEDRMYAVKENCTNKQSFTELWRSVFREIQLHYSTRGMIPLVDEVNATLLHFIDQDNPVEITPADVRFVLSQFPREQVLIILDEFDRIKDEDMIVNMVDTIKILSDYVLPFTLLLVGVGDSVNQLISEHASLPRALSQIHIPRMSSAELDAIIEGGVRRLGMSIDGNVKKGIVDLSQGLPHYTHLLALEATRNALAEGRKVVGDGDLKEAIRSAIEKAQESTLTNYYNAVHVPRGVMYPTVLLGCAIAKKDMRGYFSPTDVGVALKKITGKDYNFSSFARHLKEFSTIERGSILNQTGDSRRYKYRFSDPVMQPFLLMKGISEGQITERLIDAQD